MVAGRTQSCKVVYSPSGVNRKGFTVSSSNTGVATAEVSNTDSFTLRALKAGSSKITVSYAAGEGVPDYSFTLYVHESDPVIEWDTDFTGPAGRIDNASQGMIPGETFTLRAHVNNLQDSGVTFELVGESNAVTLTESGLMLPQKSVTAILGVSPTPRSRRSGCGHCPMRDICAFRKEGKTCEDQ